MSQPNEHVFFNERGIYISQIRFVTHDGQTFPTRTLQRSFVSLVRPWGCLAQMAILFFGFLGILAAFPLIFGTMHIIVWYAAEEVMIGNFFEPGPSWTAVILSAATIGIAILGIMLAAARRRHRWTANFMFAGGGAFTTSGSISTSGTFSSSTGRAADYSVWDSDQQWIRDLVTAANEAMLAVQQA